MNKAEAITLRRGSAFCPYPSLTLNNLFPVSCTTWQATQQCKPMISGALFANDLSSRQAQCPLLLSAAILVSRTKDVFDETTRDPTTHQRL